VPVDARSLRLAVKDDGDQRLGSLEITLPLSVRSAPAGNGSAGP